MQIDIKNFRINLPVSDSNPKNKTSPIEVEYLNEQAEKKISWLKSITKHFANTGNKPPKNNGFISGVKTPLTITEIENNKNLISILKEVLSEHNITEYLEIEFETEEKEKVKKRILIVNDVIKSIIHTLNNNHESYFNNDSNIVNFTEKQNEYLKTKAFKDNLQKKIHKEITFAVRFSHFENVDTPKYEGEKLWTKDEYFNHLLNEIKRKYRSVLIKTNNEYPDEKYTLIQKHITLQTKLESHQLSKTESDSLSSQLREVRQQLHTIYYNDGYMKDLHLGKGRVAFTNLVHSKHGGFLWAKKTMTSPESSKYNISLPEEIKLQQELTNPLVADMFGYTDDSLFMEAGEISLYDLTTKTSLSLETKDNDLHYYNEWCWAYSRLNSIRNLLTSDDTHSAFSSIISELNATEYNLHMLASNQDKNYSYCELIDDDKNNISNLIAQLRKVSNETSSSEILELKNKITQLINNLEKNISICMQDFMQDNGFLRDAKKALPLTLIHKIAGQLFKAIQYMESKNVRHADMSLSNIVITKTGNIKIIDFGMASWADNQESKWNKKTALHQAIYHILLPMLNLKLEPGYEIYGEDTIIDYLYAENCDKELITQVKDFIKTIKNKDITIDTILEHPFVKNEASSISVLDTPDTNASMADTPFINSLVINAPVTNTSVVDTPVMSSSTIDESAVNSSGTDKTIVDANVTDAPAPKMSDSIQEKNTTILRKLFLWVSSIIQAGYSFIVNIIYFIIGHKRQSHTAINSQ